MGKVDFKKLVKDARDSEAYLVEKASMSFLVDIWRLMKEKEITQKQLAEKAGLKESYISRIFARKGNLTLATMVKLAKSLDTHIKIEVEARKSAQESLDFIFKKPTPTPEAKVVYTNIHHVNTSHWKTTEDESHERINSAA